MRSASEIFNKWVIDDFFKEEVLEAMEEYARESIKEFLKLKAEIHKKEREWFHKKCVELGGMFSYVGKQDDQIIDELFKQQSK